MAVTQVKTLGIADDAVTEAKVANDAIGLPEMKAGTDGEIITYDASGNPAAIGAGSSGQVLTSRGAGTTATFQALPASNNYVHPNHSGEVTSTADGATVIASDIVDEDNLKISNAGSDGQFLSKQSGDTGGLTWATVTSQDTLSFRNLIINGDLSIAQRGTGTSSSLNGWDNANGPDRFNMDSNLASLTGTISQDSESPAGFSKSFKVDLTGNTGAMGATEYISIRQKIEAQNLQHLQNGTSGAVSTTLSFWVRSSITGTYGVRIRKEDNTAREITGTYAISAADTWEKKTITFAGDTAGGGIDNNNGAGLQISWVLGAGSNYTSTDSSSWIDAATAGQFYGHTATFTSQNATFYLTGVQYETGTTATEFEHIPYRNQLENCRRYFMKGGGWPMFADRTTDAHNCGRVGMYWFPVIMRTAPTMTDLSMTVYSGSAQTLGTQTIKTDWVWFNHTGSFSDGREWCLINTFTASAEL